MPGSIIRPARAAPITAPAAGGCSTTFAPRTACRIASAASSSSPPTKASASVSQRCTSRREINGVEGVEIIEAAAARRLEPELACVAAMRSPETGIIDSHGYMLALRGDLEDHGGMIAFDSRSSACGGRRGAGRPLRRERSRSRLSFDAVINCAGLGAQRLARATEGYPVERVPRLVLAKGNYFGFAGRPVFSRLIYPVPVPGGLGVHVTLDLAGRMRFGPDVEWIEDENYDVDPARAQAFYARIRDYWPRLPDGSLRRGLRRHQAEADGAGGAGGRFHDRRSAPARARRLIHMFGIESPGLTSALSLAEEVTSYLSS